MHGKKKKRCWFLTYSSANSSLTGIGPANYKRHMTKEMMSLFRASNDSWLKSQIDDTFILSSYYTQISMRKFHGQIFKIFFVLYIYIIIVIVDDVIIVLKYFKYY